MDSLLAFSFATGEILMALLLLLLVTYGFVVGSSDFELLSSRVVSLWPVPALMLSRLCSSAKATWKWSAFICWILFLFVQVCNSSIGTVVLKLSLSVGHCSLRAVASFDFVGLYYL